MRNKLMRVILNLIQDLSGFPIPPRGLPTSWGSKSGMTRWSLLLFLVLGIGIFFFAHRTTAQEQNQQAYDVACEVTDVPTLQECVRKAKNKEYDLIRIMNIVECVSKDDCAIDLSNVDKAIKIYGVNTDTGFKRTGNFDYSLFTIKNSKDIVIGSFLIDDTSEGSCTGSCPPAIVIENSTNITVDQLRAKSVKSTAISVKNASSITIKDSVFTDSSSAALVFSADGTNSITNNTFTHNHKGASFADCVGICTGAQVYIMPNTKNVTFSKNIVKDGNIDIYDALGLYASGIDVAGENVENVTLSCNKIYNNTGNGIVIPQQSSTTGIRIEKNSVYKNGIDLNLNTVSQNTNQDNCFSSSCQAAGC